MRLLGDELEAVARQAGPRPAVVEQGASLSYGGLLGWSDAVLGELGRLGDVYGRRVALILPNSGSFIASFLGVARAGGVAAPLNPGLQAREVVNYLADMQPAAIVVDRTGLSLAAEAVRAAGGGGALLVVGGPGECHTFERGRATDRSSPAGGDPPGLLLYTSGSTGPPRGALRSQTRLLRELEVLRAVLDVTPEDRVLGLAPFSHVNGLVRSMLAAMFAGATLYPVDRFRPATVLELIDNERLTLFGGVPQMFVLLAQAARRRPAGPTSLRLAFSSSAPLLPGDNRAFQRAFGIFVRQLYGSTETGTISYNDDADLESCLESVGRPLPGVELAIIGDDGAALETGLEGEVVVSSEFAGAGYVGDPAGGERFRDGRYRTGDLGYLDSGGSLTLTGRKDFVINRGGYKVSPHEVEQAILEHPKVADVVVLGTPAPHGDQLVRCIVVARTSCTADEIIGHCRTRIADYKIPSQIEFRDTLPRTATGKLRRPELSQ